MRGFFSEYSMTIRYYLFMQIQMDCPRGHKIQ
jgi:hypothetical protein